MHLLGVCLYRVFGIFSLRVVVVAVSEFEETEVRTLMIDVAAYAFKSSEQESLTHHVEVTAQRIHKFHGVCVRIAVKVCIVCCLRERVVHYLVEAASHKLLTHNVLQTMVMVSLAYIRKRALELRGNLHIIISVYSQDVLHHVARTLHVNPVCRHRKLKSSVALSVYCHVKALHYALYRVLAYSLANEIVHVAVFKCHL